MKLTVRDLTHAIKGQLISGNPRTEVNGASIDSRTLTAGNIFFALTGERVDGHAFVLPALERGAGAAVVSDIHWMTSARAFQGAVIKVSDPLDALRHVGMFARASFHGGVVGITGSNGKTTTKQMLASVLSVRAPGLFTRGNFNSQIGLPLVLAALEPEHKWMALEMGASAPGQIAALAEIAHPTVGVLTSIGPAHLATFGSLQRIAETKWEIMDSLPADGCGVAPWGEPLLDPYVRVFRKKLVFFGENSSCPVRATSIDLSERVHFRLYVGSDSAEVTLPVPGRYNVSNALAAAAAAWTLGYSVEEIATGLTNFEPPAMRTEILHHSSGAVLINDAYNANPASMLQSVRSLVESYPRQRKVVVVGSMLELGTESERYHFHVGTELGRFALEHILSIGDETKALVEGATSVGAKSTRIERMASMPELTKRLQPYLTRDTVILFKGSRGMQLERAVNELMAPAKKGK